VTTKTTSANVIDDTIVTVPMYNIITTTITVFVHENATGCPPSTITISSFLMIAASQLCVWALHQNSTDSPPTPSR
jgi:hypothetical protein